MAFTFGFYNSLNGDRKYSAEQISAIFDGLIGDGVFATIGTHFAVRPGDESLQVVVGTGKAWFDHTWNVNDADMVLQLDAADLTLPRFDAIVLEILQARPQRVNSIKVIKGTPAVQPAKPLMVNEGDIHQYPLAYVKVNGAATAITTTDIENVVGLTPCPFVTGILATTPIDSLFEQWDGEFNDWWENIQATLNDNVVTNLQNQIDQRVKIADKATTAQAQSGSDDTKWMTPLKTKQAITNLGVVPYYKNRPESKQPATGIVVANWFEPIAKVIIDPELNPNLTVQSDYYAAFYSGNVEVTLDTTGNISKRTINGVSNFKYLTSSTTELSNIYFLTDAALSLTLYKKVVGSSSYSSVITVTGNRTSWTLDPYIAPADTWVVSSQLDRTSDNRSAIYTVRGYKVSANSLSSFSIPVKSGYNDGCSLLCYRYGRALCLCTENNKKYLYFLNLDTNTFTEKREFLGSSAEIYNSHGFSSPYNNNLYFWSFSSNTLYIKGYNQSGTEILNKNVSLGSEASLASNNNPIYISENNSFYWLPANRKTPIVKLTSSGTVSTIPVISENMGPRTKANINIASYDPTKPVIAIQNLLNSYDNVWSDGVLWDVTTGKWNYLTDGGVLGTRYEDAENAVSPILKKGDYILARGCNNYLWMLYHVKTPRVSGLFSVIPYAATEWN